jgi:predicted metal-dependent hydrolase
MRDFDQPLAMTVISEKKSEKRSVRLCGEDVEYVLKRSSRAKHLRLAIHRDGRFVATLPSRISLDTLERFIIEKAEWIVNQLATMRERGASGQAGILAKQDRREFVRLKSAAKAIVRSKIETLNAIYGFAVGRVAIRNQKTRWGSCSKEGNLNFNYKIALLPEPLAEYLVAHELCHLKEFNHGAGFWNLVARTIPDYKERRQELRRLERASS